MEQAWMFLRGDLPVTEFESWVYANERLESELGRDLYFKAIETDYRSAPGVSELRVALREWADAATVTACECVKLPNLGIIPMGFTDGSMLGSDTVFAELTVLVKRGAPYWWLAMCQCDACGDRWLVGQEEHINDVFTMKRLSDTEATQIEGGDWPETFDRYETLLRMGRDAGYSARFVDPLNSRSLAWVTADLINERPDITVEELAALLQLDLGTAAAIAANVARDQGPATAGLAQAKRRFAKLWTRRR